MKKHTIKIILKKPKKKGRVALKSVKTKTTELKEKQPLTKPLKQEPREEKRETKPAQANKAAAPIANKTTAPKPEQKPNISQPIQKATAPLKWNPILSKYMGKIRNDIGLKQVMFAMISDGGANARICELIGADADSGLNHFLVNIQKNNLFKLLLLKQQSFWLKPSNQEKFLPAIPKEVVDLIDQNGFFCMSLFVRGKAVGLIYTDGKQAMDENNYVAFKKLCAELGVALGQATE